MTITKYETEDKKDILADETFETDTRTKIKIALISIGLGLTLNWISLFLSITLGLLSIGISVFIVLLIAKIFLGNQATRQNLAIISIAYGATAAAEASVGLLFLIWLSMNASSFGLSGNFPSWLLPSPEVLASKTLFSPEWLVPLAVHYFLMIIPGFAGIIMGLYLKNRYIHDDEKYPWPGIVQRNKMIDVLVVNQSDKVKLFRNFLIAGFVFAFITLFIPVIDFSRPREGWIIGLTLGAIGVALFAVGFIVGNWKITVTSGISSIAVYVLLSPFLAKQSYLEAVENGSVGTSYFDFYTFALQDVYMSFIIGFLLSTVLISPIIWKMMKKIRNIFIGERKVITDVANEKETTESNPETQVTTETGSNSATPTKGKITNTFASKLLSFRFSKKNLVFISFYTMIYVLSVLFVYYTGMLGDNLLIIAVVMFWILIVASLVLGIITAESMAKTATAVMPPFIFDLIPLFLAGARGFVPYLATPKSEAGETMSIVRNAKFSSVQGVSTKTMLGAYLTGYIPAIITTPFFALLLFVTLGIGTNQLPAPGFPIQAMLIAPFAAGSIEAVLNIAELLLGMLLAIVMIPGTGIGLAIGMFFPPHMALAISLGGILRMVMDKKFGKDRVKDKGTTAATAVSVGASLTIPIMIVLALLL
ncbi:MAG: OPT/YSL family transporter [Candidatus Hodarchaeales archaeon]